MLSRQPQLQKVLLSKSSASSPFRAFRILYLFFSCPRWSPEQIAGWLVRHISCLKTFRLHHCCVRISFSRPSALPCIIIDILSVIVSAIAALGVSAVTPDEACNFIGMRFAGVDSSCYVEWNDSGDDRYTCTDISESPEYGFIVASSRAELTWNDIECSRAAEIVSNIFTGIPPATHNVTEILRILDEEIVRPGYTALVSLGLLSIPPLEPSLARINRALTGLAAANWTQWHTDAIVIMQSAEYASFGSLVRDLQDHSACVPFWDRLDSGVREPILRFFTELRGLIRTFDFEELSDFSLSGARTEWIARHVRPPGRQAYMFEEPTQAEFFYRSMSVRSTVEVTNAFLSLARNGSDVPDAELLESVFKIWDPKRDVESTTDALLKHLIETQLCGVNFRQTLGRVVLVRDSYLISKLGVSLAYICREFTSNLTELHFWFARIVSAYGTRTMRARGSWLVDESFLEQIVTTSTSYVARTNALVRMRTFNRFLSARDGQGDNMRETLRGLGRIMGAAMRTNTKLLSLRLSPSLVAAMHEDCWAGDLFFEDADDFGIAMDDVDGILSLILEPQFFVRQGIIDLVGPAGPQILTCKAWMGLFSAPATERLIA